MASEGKAPATGGLLHILGIGFGLAGAVGGTIGAGILRTPGLVAAQLGSAERLLAVWVAGGLYAMLGALCVAELATSLPRAGGWTVYARRAFGPAMGFSVGWMDWLGHCAGLAWVALTVGEYAVTVAPSLALGARTIAVAVLALFALIQIPGLKAGSGSLQLLSLAKALAFLVLVGACFLLPVDTFSRTATAELVPPLVPPADPAALVGGLVVALQAVITTYDGWHNPIYFAEEFATPERDLPRSLLGGVAAILSLYLLLNLAVLRVLPLPAIAASTLPVADAAAVIFGPLSGRFITVLALVSLLGLINAVIMAAPRILFGLGRDGLVPPRLAAVNEGGTPVTALALTAGATITLVLAGDFRVLLGLASFFYVVLYLCGIAAQLLLRLREPELARPFRVWGHPWPGLVVLAGSTAFLIAAVLAEPRRSLVAALLILVSVPLYRLAPRGGPACETPDEAKAG